MFFEQLNKHLPKNLFNQKHVFVNKCDYDIPEDYKVSYFDSDKLYREQFLSCITDVKDEFCVYISEDYILYDDVEGGLINEFVTVLKNNSDISFVRFMRGGTVDLMHKYKSHERLYKLYNYLPYFYTNQAALWRTRDLEEIHVQGPALHIGNEDYENSFEFQATKTCEKLGIEGAFYHNNEPKRGLYHYDTEIFPHVSTALVKGKWNISEYKKELVPLLEKYDIDVSARGSV